MLHYSYAKTTEKEVFNGEKVSKIIFGKKGKMHGGKTLATTKFQNPTGNTIFVCRGKAFTRYVLNYVHVCRRNRLV